MRILRLVNSLTETSAPWHQFSVPVADRHQITIVSYFPPEVSDPRICVLSGKGSLQGTRRAIRAALTDEPEVIHIHYGHMAALFVLVVGWRLPHYWKRTVYTVHTSYPNLKARNKLLTAVAFVCLRKIVFCSYASRASFPRFVVRALGSRALVVQNGVDIQRIDRAMQ